jgi:hypothetical protein
MNALKTMGSLLPNKVVVNPEWRSLIPEGELGDCKIEKFEISLQGAQRENLRYLMQGMGRDRFVSPGHHTRLLIGGETMMSDTQAEYLDHLALFNMAAGHVLVMGLGLGCAASVLAANPDVENVTVVEINSNVIELVEPTLRKRFGHKIQVIHDDAFTWSPKKGTRYGAAWFDIWLNICDTNIPEMIRLKRRFARRCNWMGCWSEPEARWMRGVAKRMNQG